MNEKASVFQIILFSTLIVLIVAAVLIFSNQSGGSKVKLEDVVMWGTLPKEIISSMQEAINVDDELVSIKYQEFQAENFEKELVEALASGTGPDLVLLPDDLLYKHKNKLFNISYESYPQKNFQNSFIQAGDALLNLDGFLGFPYIIDPMVIYFNRSILNSSAISEVPKTWNDILDAAPKITKIDNNLNLLKSAIALGEFKNIENAKDILNVLIMQAGNPVIKKNRINNTATDENVGEEFEVLLKDSLGEAQAPGLAALNFYTQFSNPNLNVYSWNRSLKNSKEMFLAGDLAFYIGYASEYTDILRKNPNLNFGVSMLPQKIGEELNKKTIAQMTIIGVTKQSTKLQAAFNAISYLTNDKSIKILSDRLNLPPVRRSLLADRNDNAAIDVFNQSALISSIFWDPDNTETDEIYMNMIESYTSGRVEANSAVNRAHEELMDLIK